MSETAYQRRSFSGIAAATALNGGITNISTTIVVEDSTGWPTGTNGPFYVCIDRGQASEEKVLITSRTGNSLAVDTRGADGTTAASHSSGSPIEHVFVARDADEANYTVAQTVGKIAAAGDLLYGSAANTLAKLTKGTSGQFLKIGGSAPAWATLVGTDISDLTEKVQDIVGAFATEGANIDLTYDDTANTLTVAVTGLASTDLSDFTEAVQDVVGALGLGGSGLTFTYTDGSNTAVLDVNVDDSTIEVATDALQVKDGGITSAKIADGTIVNADVNASAAIALTKTDLQYAYTSYTPAITGSSSGGTIGNGTIAGYYNQIGKTVNSYGKLTLGSTTSFGTGNLQISLPVNMKNNSLSSITIGTGLGIDASPATNYTFTAVCDPTGAAGKFLLAIDSSIYVSGSAPLPITWATGDVITWSVTYEAA